MRFRIVPGSAVPIYRQIVEQVRSGIARGDLQAGEGVPSVRVLAEELVVNPNTVAKAFAELVRSGELVSEPGRGVFVAKHRPEMGAVEKRKGLKQLAERAIADAIPLGVSREELIAAIEMECDRVGVMPK